MCRLPFCYSVRSFHRLHVSYSLISRNQSVISVRCPSVRCDIYQNECQSASCRDCNHQLQIEQSEHHQNLIQEREGKTHMHAGHKDRKHHQKKHLRAYALPDISIGHPHLSHYLETLLILETLRHLLVINNQIQSASLVPPTIYPTPNFVTI